MPLIPYHTPLPAAAWDAGSRGLDVAGPIGWLGDDLAFSAPKAEPVSPTGTTRVPAPNPNVDDSVARFFGTTYALVDRSRRDVASLARFAHRVEVATFYMCAAFEQAGVRDFTIGEKGDRPGHTVHWLASIADTTFCRFRVLSRALKHNWTPPEEVEILIYAAFDNLCELTPSGIQLKQLYVTRRDDAIKALVKQLGHTAEVLMESVSLASQSDAAVHERVEEEDAARLASIQAEILGQAGETLGLRPAAKRLGTTHQNLHKRIRSGSALGVMHGRELVVPAFQFVGEGSHSQVLPGLKDVLALFGKAGAGAWSALQFLTSHDPLLGGVPADRLQGGDIEAVIHAARGYLGLDES